ncbi:MAG TPA: DRTGG domain-containing protein [Thermodesulfobacteriota bacterium]|nr:DRTGG domain-containing protein [Thermodesulfobacteriota bacterium]
MTLREVVEKLGTKPVSALSRLPEEFTGGYVSDLLSDVMANAKAGDVWITLQVHQNIVAVATLKELAAIIIIGGRQPEKQTLAKAEEERIPILLSELTAFEVAGRLYQMGISGR